jgi:hypothetical protein
MLLLIVEVLFRIFQFVSYSVTLYEVFKHTVIPVAYSLRELRFGRRETFETTRKWYDRRSVVSPVEFRNVLPFSRFEKQS